MIAADPRFYQSGGTLPPHAPSYVERQADQALYEGLLRGDFCYVLTSRQMGKSSLTARTAVRLRQTGEPRFGRAADSGGGRSPGVAVVSLDLTAIGQNLTVEQWYGGLLDALGVALDLEDELEEFWFEQKRSGPLQRWMAALREVVLARVPGRIVIFVDEIDMVRSLPFSTDEFFAAIRECYNRRGSDPQFERLAFCLLGVASPSDLIQDTRTTPFNIGRRIELRDFTEAAAAPLAAGLDGATGRRGDRASKALLQRVLYWTDGHPYLTQRLCQAVAEDGTVTTPAGVDRLCEELFLSPRAREKDDNLLFVRERLLRSEADPAGLLDLYGQVRRGNRVRDDETNALISLLRLAGIVRVEAGVLRVRNRIYAHVFDRRWVTTQMPDAELRRQRAAYRQGLLRMGAAASMVLAVIGALALSAFRLAGERKTALGVSRRLLYAAQMGLARELLAGGDVERAEALLLAQQPKQGEEELRGFAWRYLWRLRQHSGARFTLLGHRNEVWGAAYSPDGRMLATSSADRTVRLWDLATKRTLAILKGHTGTVRALAFSPDGKRLATAGEDRTVRLWDLPSRRLAATLRGHTDWIERIAFSPDGKLLASASDDETVKLWDVASRRLAVTLRAHRGGASGGVSGVAFSPDGKWLASGGFDNTIKLWDVASRRNVATLRGPRGPVIDLAFSPDGRMLAASQRLRSSFSPSEVALWDLPSRRQIASLRGHIQDVGMLAFSPEGRRLASASDDGTVRLWDVPGRRLITILRGHRGYVLGVAFSPDGESIASTSGDGTVKLWDAAPAPTTDVLRGHREFVLKVAFSPDGKTLATGAFDGTVRLWDVAAHREIAALKQPTRLIQSVAFSPDGRTLAVGSRKERWVRLWDVATRRQITALPARGSDAWSVAFAPDGKTLATGGTGGMIELWDPVTHRQVAHRQVASLPGHRARVLCLAFSPDGRLFASGAADGQARLWDVGSGREIATLRGHSQAVRSVAFSPNGGLLASGSDDSTIRLWEISTRRCLGVLQGRQFNVSSVAFSPDGKELASGGDDGTLKLWSLTTQQEVLTLKEHIGGIFWLAFSPDGNTLATASGDTTVRLWHAASR
jgi:WD40 repeat protein